MYNLSYHASIRLRSNHTRSSLQRPLVSCADSGSVVRSQLLPPLNVIDLNRKNHHRYCLLKPKTPNATMSTTAQNPNMNSMTPSKTPGGTTKLSTLAMFDDMCRYQTSFYGSFMDYENGSDVHSKFLEMLKNYEENRKKWKQALDDLRERDSIIQKLQHDIHVNESRMNSLRMAYSREIRAKEQLKKDYIELKKKMQLLKELIMDDGNVNFNVTAGVGQRDPKMQTAISGSSIMQNSPARAQLVSLLTTFEKQQQRNQQYLDESDESDDGLLFDKSDDSIDIKQPKVAKLEPKPSSTQVAPVQVIPTPNNVTNVTPVNNRSRIMAKENVESKIDENHVPTSDIPLSSKASTATLKSNGGTPRRGLSNIYARMMKNQIKLEPERLSTRPHKFMEKTALLPQTCVVCNVSFVFCSSYLQCVQCRGLVHNRCQQSLAKPCLPHFTGSGLKRMMSTTGTPNSPRIGVRMAINDFVQCDVRPCIPALLIHCCNEIDRRIALAMNNKHQKDTSLVGLYRVCGVEKEIRDLRNRILEAKNGIPNLKDVSDVHTICGVVKMFLRCLNDSLLTKIMWYDFARASDHVVQTKPKQIDEGSDRPDSGLDDHCSENDSDEDSPLQIFKEYIFQLPLPNRDSLSFLMLHLKNVADAEPVTKMTIAALSNIFAPTIVGDSGSRSLSSNSLIKQNAKQLIIMNALFTVEMSFWKKSLTEQNFLPFKDKDLVKMSPMNAAAHFSSRLAKISSKQTKNSTPETTIIDNNNNGKNKQISPNQSFIDDLQTPNGQPNKRRRSIDLLRESMY